MREWQKDWDDIVSEWHTGNESMGDLCPPETKKLLDEFAEQLTREGTKKVGVFDGTRSDFLQLKEGMQMYEEEEFEIAGHTIRVSYVRGPRGERIACIDPGSNAMSDDTAEVLKAIFPCGPLPEFGL